LPHKAPKYKKLNYRPDIDNVSDAHEVYLEQPIQSYYMHYLTRRIVDENVDHKIPTTNSYVSEVSRIFHLSKVSVLLENSDPSNSLMYMIEGSADRDFWVELVAETDLLANKTKKEDLTDEPCGWIRVSWKSKVADTPALISVIVCGKT